MANATQENKLAADYEAVRRRQYELISGLLEIAPRIDGLSPDSIAQLRDALFHADHPYMIVFIGPFNAGKSSLINTLIGEHDLQPIGPTPTTDRISIIRWGDELTRSRSGDVETTFYPSPLLQKVSFVDTPGLESVFKAHEEVTRRFLHRSDTVLLVMLATQAMTQRNLDYLQFLKDYGKNVILVLNQIDLLSADEVQTVRQYVLEQSREKLGFEPELWLTSTRIAAAARLPNGSLDATRWQESGLAQIEAFVERQMNDTTRLRQKMQTPMQIVEHVHQEAMAHLKQNQSALDHYQSIAGNIDGQIAVCKREQEKSARATEAEVKALFTQIADRGAAALVEQFQLGRGLVSLARGTLELVGLAGIARASSQGSYSRAAFEKHKVFEAVRDLAPTVDRLAPRLEGRDVQDLDDLVTYARKEIDALPPEIKSKVIGTVQAPIKYDRAALLTIHKALDPITEEVQETETVSVERIVRNTLLFLAAWELLIVIFIVFSIAAFPLSAPESPLPILLIVLFGMALLGLAFLPLRGRMIQHEYRRRVAAVETKYIDAVRAAADKQIAYGLQLRRDTVAPLTRVIESQTETQMDQLKRLQAAAQEITAIEAAAAAMGKPSFSLVKGVGKA